MWRVNSTYKKKSMNICIYTVHLFFLYECITRKVKSCLSNYCIFHISYVTTITQTYKIISMKNYFWWTSCRSGWSWPTISINVTSDVFHCHAPGEKSSWMPHPSPAMISWDVLTCSIHASNRDIWSCGLWSYIFHLHSQRNGSDCAVGNLHIYAP